MYELGGSGMKARTASLAVAITVSLFSAGDATQRNAQAQTGTASVYSTESGTRTASGGNLQPGALTAAHRTLPFGTKVKVTNTRNGRSVVVTINDRGPFTRGRLIEV